MIFRTGTPKRLSLAGLFGLLGLGGLLLTWSPAPTTAAAQDDDAKVEKKIRIEIKGGGDRQGIRIQIPDDVRAAFQDDGRSKKPAPPRPAAGRKDGELDDTRAELDRLRAELRERQAQLDKMQRELDRKTRELQGLADKGRAGQAVRPGAEQPRPTPRPEAGQPPQPRFDNPPVGPAPGNRGPGFQPQPGNPNFGGPEVERRIDNLERKLDMMIQELGNMRREMANRGGGGGGAFGGGFGGQGGGGGFGGGGFAPGPKGPAGFAPQPGAPGAGFPGGPGVGVPGGPGFPGQPPGADSRPKEKKGRGQGDGENPNNFIPRKGPENLGRGALPGAGDDVGVAPAPTPRRANDPDQPKKREN